MKHKPEYKRTKEGLYICPECAKEVSSPQGLGKHRTLHGVVGSSLSTLAHKKAKLNKNQSNGLLDVKAKRTYKKRTPKKEKETTYLGKVNYCPCCAFPLRNLMALEQIQNEVQ